MTHAISRRQLLAGDLRGADRPIRPPWALGEEAFIDRCSGCGDCVVACSSKLVVVGAGRLPEMRFNSIGCSFCGDCRRVCKTGALDGGSEVPWRLRAGIKASCLSINGVICRSCGEVCDERAIRFQLQLGGIARPHVDDGRCNGCGACYAVCPVRAVELRGAADDASAELAA